MRAGTGCPWPQAGKGHPAGSPSPGAAGRPEGGADPAAGGAPAADRPRGLLPEPPAPGRAAGEGGGPPRAAGPPLQRAARCAGGGPGLRAPGVLPAPTRGPWLPQNSAQTHLTPPLRHPPLKRTATPAPTRRSPSSPRAGESPVAGEAAPRGPGSGGATGPGPDGGPRAPGRTQALGVLNSPCSFLSFSQSFTMKGSSSHDDFKFKVSPSGGRRGPLCPPPSPSPPARPRAASCGDGSSLGLEGAGGRVQV